MVSVGCRCGMLGLVIVNLPGIAVMRGRSVLPHRASPPWLFSGQFMELCCDGNAKEERPPGFFCWPTSPGMPPMQCNDAFVHKLSHSAQAHP